MSKRETVRKSSQVYRIISENHEVGEDKSIPPITYPYTYCSSEERTKYTELTEKNHMQQLDKKETIRKTKTNTLMYSQP